MADSYLNSLLGDKEEILLVARQHWLVLLEEITSELLLSIAIIILIVGLSVFTGPLALIGLVILVAPLASLTRDVLKWSNRKYVITNRRVIQISGVFNKDVVDSSLEKVNDVMLDQTFLGRIFGYGDIEVLTASEIGVNKIRRIANPIQYKIAMVNAKAKLEGVTAAPSAGSDAPALIAQLDFAAPEGGHHRRGIPGEEGQAAGEDLDSLAVCHSEPRSAGRGIGDLKVYARVSLYRVIDPFPSYARDRQPLKRLRDDTCSMSFGPRWGPGASRDLRGEESATQILKQTTSSPHMTDSLAPLGASALKGGLGMTDFACHPKADLAAEELVTRKYTHGLSLSRYRSLSR